MTEQIPEWAVERADDLCAQILERATNTDYGIGVSLDARDLIAAALAEAAKPGWKPIAEAPKDGMMVDFKVALSCFYGVAAWEILTGIWRWL